MLLTGSYIENLSHRKISTIVNSTVKTAETIHLTYVNDSGPGITRVKKGKGFSYLLNKRKVNPKQLERIKKM